MSRVTNNDRAKDSNYTGISVWVSKEDHKKLKVHALLEGVTLRDLTTDMMEEYISNLPDQIIK